jgi:tRNA threonylcarbamoyladenosine biosynthesis protein TsaE
VSITYSLNEIDLAVTYILKHSKSKVLLFDAPMGTGKTTLIKALVKALGCNDTVSSPTFSLVNEYITNDCKLFHFDLYRIEDTEELYDFGIEMYLEDDAYLCVEWPLLLAPILDKPYHVISINLDEKLNRVLELKNSL